MLSNKLLQGQELIEADRETGTEEVEDKQRSRSMVLRACLRLALVSGCQVRWLRFADALFDPSTA